MVIPNQISCEVTLSDIEYPVKRPFIPQTKSVSHEWFYIVHLSSLSDNNGSIFLWQLQLRHNNRLVFSSYCLGLQYLCEIVFVLQSVLAYKVTLKGMQH